MSPYQLRLPRPGGVSERDGDAEMEDERALKNF